jgi:hypothetical protein
MDHTPTHGQQGGTPLPWQQGGTPPPAPQPPAPQPYPSAPQFQPSAPPFQPSTPPHPAYPSYPSGPCGGIIGPLPPPPRRRRWVPVVAAVVVVLLLVTGAAVAWRVLGGGDDAAPPAASTDSGRSSASPAATGSSLGDEFDGTGLEEPKWGIYSSSSPNGSVWSRDAVTVRDGILRITGTGRNPTGGGNVAGGVCWCGAGGNQTSGVWAVRARFDAGTGYGPGLMLWPRSDKASDGFATFAGFPQGDRSTVRSLVMWGTAGGKSETTLTGDFTQWHIYRVEWRPNELKMFVDDQVLFDSTAQPGVVVPATPMHLVIQVVAGPKDGVPAPDATTPENVVTEVDWVRYSR